MVLVLGVTLVGCANAGPAEGTVRVVDVVDGDTFRAIVGGREERIRLIGVDTPEVPWYGGEGECFGSEAGAFAKDRLEGRSVRLIYDRERRDRYDRLLAYVYIEEELFNLTLLREGYATTLKVPPNTSMAAEFDRAEEDARAAGLGLWAACPSPG
ncbi:hypothetical protein BH20ACT24_BH20ACT24_00360 [soil metagenome]